jgi:hypothetical protein
MAKIAPAISKAGAAGNHRLECEPAAELAPRHAALTNITSGAIMADPTLAKTDEQTEPPARADQRELRRRLNSVASSLIALGMELPDPGELGNEAEAAQMRRLLLRYLGPAQDRLADYEKLLTGQPRLRWFR